MRTQIEEQYAHNNEIRRSVQVYGNAWSLLHHFSSEICLNDEVFMNALGADILVVSPSLA